MICVNALERKTSENTVVLNIKKWLVDDVTINAYLVSITQQFVIGIPTLIKLKKIYASFLLSDKI